MTHASLESLEAYASGTLRAGARMAVGLHLRACARCRRQVDSLEALAGGLLEDAPVEAMGSDALAKAIRQLDQPETSAPRLTSDHLMAKGWWLPLGPGLSIKVLKVLADPGERAYLIRAEGGVALPDHGHTGHEWVTVLTGAFEDRTGRHDAGALVESDGDETHQPVACAGETCLCLAVTEGPLKLKGMARLMQPFLGV